MEREDQVKRKLRLLADHPQLVITHYQHPQWHYTCVWYDGGIRREIAAGELRELIDLVLEALTESPQRLRDWQFDLAGVPGRQRIALH